MSIFKSKREKKLWLWTLAVVFAIYASLGVVRPIATFLRSNGLLEATFFTGFFLIVVAIVANGLRSKPGKAEIAVWIGIIAVYLFMMVRMAMPEERTHLIEYSVVGIFVHQALLERKKQGGKLPYVTIIAIFITILLGVIDEVIQYFLPTRVFDPRDILFNTLAGSMAILSALVLNKVRDKFRK